MNYKVTVDGKEIEYGALVEKSRFSEKRMVCYLFGDGETKSARSL